MITKVTSEYFEIRVSFEKVTSAEFNQTSTEVAGLHGHPISSVLTLKDAEGLEANISDPRAGEVISGLLKAHSERRGE